MERAGHSSAATPNPIAPPFALAPRLRL